MHNAVTRSFARRRLLVGCVVVSLAAVQIAQALTAKLTGYMESYWQVTYETGFIRRGLGGQMLLLGGEPMLDVVRLAVWLTGVLPTLAVLVVLGGLVRLGTRPALLAAVLLAASPFCLDQELANRRPDQFGLVVLVVALLVCVHARRTPWVTTALCGLAFAALALVHEGAVLFYAVFAPALVLLTRAESVTRRLMLAVIIAGPGALAAVVALVAGAATSGQLGTLEILAQSRGLIYEPVDIYHSTLPFLDDSMAESLAFVGTVPPVALVATVLGCSLLILVQIVWWKRCVGPLGLVNGRWSLVAWMIVLVDVVLVFATGVDWPRWFSVFGSGALLVLVARVWADERRQPSDDERPMLVPVVVAVLLASFQPLFEYPDARQWITYLVPFLPYQK